MKRDTSITSLLGATQHDVAMLLGISRSQWAMYETGKRHLPLHATQLLAALVAHVQSPERNAKDNPVHLRQQLAQQKHLEQLLRENEFQQLRIARKIEATAKKHEACVKLLHLAEFVNVRDQQHKEVTLRFNPVAHKAAAKDAANEVAALTNYEIKQEVLIRENLILQSKLRKIAPDIDNKEKF